MAALLGRLTELRLKFFGALNSIELHDRHGKSLRSLDAIAGVVGVQTLRFVDGEEGSGHAESCAESNAGADCATSCSTPLAVSH